MSVNAGKSDEMEFAKVTRLKPEIYCTIAFGQVDYLVLLDNHWS